MLVRIGGSDRRRRKRRRKRRRSRSRPLLLLSTTGPSNGSGTSSSTCTDAAARAFLLLIVPSQVRLPDHDKPVFFPRRGEERVVVVRAEAGVRHGAAVAVDTEERTAFTQVPDLHGMGGEGSEERKRHGCCPQEREPTRTRCDLDSAVVRCG